MHVNFFFPSGSLFFSSGQSPRTLPKTFAFVCLLMGRVGRLSIKISWKKLGWDHPIIVVLEDVFICLTGYNSQISLPWKMYKIYWFILEALLCILQFHAFANQIASCVCHCSGPWRQLKQENMLAKRLNLLL